MLPPFVPPSARAATEALPLITEFVRHPVEHSSGRFWKGENQLSTIVAEPEVADHHEVVTAAEVGAAPEAALDVALPSITEFLADLPARTAAGAPSVPVDRPLRSWHHVPENVAQLSDPETLPEPVEDVPVINAIPIVNEYASSVAEHRVTSVDHVDAPVETAAPVDLATQASLDMESEREAPGVHTVPTSETEPEVAGAPEAKWIAEERNSFDWQSLANLAAARQNEERRAEDDWATTTWDRKAQSESEQVAALLNQVVRRVRTGELKVEATRGMSAESALAATLAALLRSDD